MPVRIKVANIVVDNSIDYLKKVTVVNMASIGKWAETIIIRSMSLMEKCSYTTDNSEGSDIIEVKAAEEAIIYLVMENFSQQLGVI
jgi:hypothetical protein